MYLRFSVFSNWRRFTFSLRFNLKLPQWSFIVQSAGKNCADMKMFQSFIYWITGNHVFLSINIQRFPVIEKKCMRALQHYRQKESRIRQTSVGLGAVCYLPIATCWCVEENGCLQISASMTLCSEGVWRVLTCLESNGSGANGRIDCFSIAEPAASQIRCFSSSIYHPRSVHCQAGEVWTTHQTGLIQFKSIADVWP